MALINLNKKKLVFLSRRVYERAKELYITNGTHIAREILEESKKLRMNFDFKNVQRRVYDALNVLTALDMIKKDRNKIEFIRDIHEVFGDGSRNTNSTPEKTKEDKLAEVAIRSKELQTKKDSVFESIREKRQYLSEITVQVALLKKLVRRNLKIEDSDTDMNTPDKAKNEGLSLEKFQHTKKIHLPMLILEFPKSADLEVLMNEDHKELIIISDTH
jgi:hypothetical protein